MSLRKRVRLILPSIAVCALLCACTPDVLETTTPSTLSVSRPAEVSVPSENVLPESTEALTLPSEPVLETVPAIAIFDPMELVSSLSIEELAGQILLARCPDIGALADLQSYHLGGYILFGRDFAGQTPDTIKKALTFWQESAEIPLLIAVDEEGGTVTRVSSYAAFRSRRFPSPRKLYADGGLSLVMETETEKCALLSSLGINMNMAPVCDVTTDPSAFMYARSLGLSPQLTGEVIAEMVRTMKEGQIASVLKHFPGYGNNTDTHIGIAVDERGLSVLEKCDLVPFEAGILAGCDAVLVSHTIVACLDEAMPASLSPAVHRYLRDEMGFGGVIVTDDLSMGAITELYGAEEAAVLAVLAGNDLLCVTDYPRQHAAIVHAAQQGRIPMELLQQAAARVIALKHGLGLL